MQPWLLLALTRMPVSDASCIAICYTLKCTHDKGPSVLRRHGSSAWCLSSTCIKARHARLHLRRAYPIYNLHVPCCFVVWVTIDMLSVNLPISLQFADSCYVSKEFLAWVYVMILKFINGDSGPGTDSSTKRKGGARTNYVVPGAGKGLASKEETLIPKRQFIANVRWDAVRSFRIFYCQAETGKGESLFPAEEMIQLPQAEEDPSDIGEASPVNDAASPEAEIRRSPRLNRAGANR